MARLFLAVGMVKTHLFNAYRRLWISSRRELAQARGEPAETAAA